MKTMIQRTLFYFLLPACLLWMAPSCDYNDFEDPDRDTPVQMTPTHTIAQLKAMYTRGGKTISEDIIIGGVVVSSDREGNVYKSLMIQDATAGIEIKLGRSGIYNFYKQGQMVYLKCQGLVIGSYGNSLDIGYTPTDPDYETDFIDTRMIDQYLFKGAIGEMPQARVVSLGSSISTTLDNTWIQINNVQFLESELALTWADAVNRVTTNRTLQDANGRTLVVRTSGYARFAGDVLPQGGGSVCGLISFYNSTPQLTIVSVGDVKLTGPRVR